MSARARLTVIIIGFALVVSACGADGPDAVLDVDAAIDGVPIADSGPGDPQRLDPEIESVLSMTITNVSDTDVEVGHVRLEGEMLGLTFLTYDTRVPLGLASGESRELTVPLDFFDLESQASGYLRSWVRLYADDADRTRLSSDEFVLDVRGDTLSTMSVFAILLFFVTALSLAHNLWALRQGTLPPNRFIRGMRLAVTGLGLGLLLSVAFSVLRIFPLPTSGWMPLTLLPAAIGFGIGYLLPGFVDEDVEDDDDDAENFVDRERLSG